MRNISIVFLVFVGFAFQSCTKDDPIIKEGNYSEVLENIANDVILATYKDLNDKTIDLHTALIALQTSPDQNNLLAAQQAWREARKPWEQSEGFLYGPVDQKGIDPAMDSWPVNQTDLDAVLASTHALTKDFIDGLDGTLKGFHTIEYLLFGVDSKKAVTDFTPRQFEYLIGCSASLQGATALLYDSWKPDGGNYIANVIHAGTTGNSIYPSQKSALEEFTNGMSGIADEVANGKINDPFTQQNVTLEESRFSANSKQDFADNIRSIRHIYLGVYQNATGKGLSQIVLAKDAALDAQIRSDIDEAISSIEAINSTFTSAIFNSKESVQNAQNKVRNLQQTIESKLLPLISNL
jgi:uncharacterized iron-regulated protein